MGGWRGWGDMSAAVVVDDKTECAEHTLQSRSEVVAGRLPAGNAWRRYPVTCLSSLSALHPYGCATVPLWLASGTNQLHDSCTSMPISAY